MSTGPLTRPLFLTPNAQCTPSWRLHTAAPSPSLPPIIQTGPSCYHFPLADYATASLAPLLLLPQRPFPTQKRSDLRIKCEILTSALRAPLSSPLALPAVTMSSFQLSFPHAPCCSRALYMPFLLPLPLSRQLLLDSGQMPLSSRDLPSHHSCPIPNLSSRSTSLWEYLHLHM